MYRSYGPGWENLNGNRKKTTCVQLASLSFSPIAVKGRYDKLIGEDDLALLIFLFSWLNTLTLMEKVTSLANI